MYMILIDFNGHVRIIHPSNDGREQVYTVDGARRIYFVSGLEGSISFSKMKIDFIYKNEIYLKRVNSSSFEDGLPYPSTSEREMIYSIARAYRDGCLDTHIAY